MNEEKMKNKGQAQKGSTNAAQCYAEKPNVLDSLQSPANNGLRCIGNCDSIMYCGDAGSYTEMYFTEKKTDK